MSQRSHSSICSQVSGLSQGAWEEVYRNCDSISEIGSLNSITAPTEYVSAKPAEHGFPTQSLLIRSESYNVRTVGRQVVGSPTPMSSVFSQELLRAGVENVENCDSDFNEVTQACSSTYNSDWYQNRMNDECAMESQNYGLSLAASSSEFPSFCTSAGSVSSLSVDASPVNSFSGIPSNTAFPGTFGFEIFFDKERTTETKKSVPYVYSIELNKLYARTLAVCAVNLKTASRPPPGSFFRLMAVYSRSQDVMEIVKRCMNHLSKDDHPAKEHFVRCMNPNASHTHCASTGRYSVCIPWEDPPAGRDYLVAFCQFTCFSSCTGTINRRPVTLVVTLEAGNNVLGRQTVEVKICACPGRDMKQELATRYGKHARVLESKTIEPLRKQSKPGSDANREDQVFTVKIKGRRLYKLVLAIVQNYYLAEHYKNRISDCERGQLTQLSDSQIFSAGVFRDFKGSSSIRDWLKVLQLSNYERHLADCGFRILCQVEGLNVENFVALKIPRKEAEMMHQWLLEWKVFEQNSQMSSLTSPSFNGLNGSHQSEVGFTITKTTIEHKYDLSGKAELSESERSN